MKYFQYFKHIISNRFPYIFFTNDIPNIPPTFPKPPQCQRPLSILKDNVFKDYILLLPLIFYFIFSVISLIHNNTNQKIQIFELIVNYFVTSMEFVSNLAKEPVYHSVIKVCVYHTL